MKRIYTYFGREEIVGKPRLFEYEPPFHDNMNEDLKQSWGAFIALIDHKRKVVKIHSAYDSGKGCIIIPPNPRKQPFSIQLKSLLETGPEVVLMEGKSYDVVLVYTGSQWIMYREGSIDYDRKIVSGYIIGNFDEKYFQQLSKKVFNRLKQLPTFSTQHIKAVKLSE